MSIRNIGQARTPKSPVVHWMALSHELSSSTFAGFGRTDIPETLPVFVCAYQARKMFPWGLSARMRHPSSTLARFSYCLLGDCTRKRPSPFGETVSRAFCINFSATFVARSSLVQTYRDTSILVHPRFCTSGCRKVFRRCLFRQSTYSARCPLIGCSTSPASELQTTLLYSFVRMV